MGSLAAHVNVREFQGAAPGARASLRADPRGDPARFAVLTARNGLAVDAWTVRRLALLTNGAVARNLLLGADSLEPEDARRLGLLGRTGGLDEAITWARDLAGMAPLNLAYSKKALDALFEEPAERESELEKLFEQCWDSDDVAEGRNARAEGRDPGLPREVSRR